MSDKRFEISSYSDKLYDTVTGEHYYYEDMEDWYKICDLLNKESERADHNAEMNTTEELLKLRWQRDIYERFSKETLRILEKYGISDLEKLDQCLFNQRVW